MILDRVTVTGADNSVEPEHLVGLSQRFPWVEWGILLSRSQEGTARFPSPRWLGRLHMLMSRPENYKVRLSGHLCGRWVRDLCLGNTDFLQRDPIHWRWDRVQLNFHAEPHAVDPLPFRAALKHWGRPEYIFQREGVNDLLMHGLADVGIRAVPLFDTSGGAGVEPESWPAPIGDYCGYAGGLHPDRIGRQIEAIAKAAGDARIWIDAETHVRSANDTRFDLSRVERFLQGCEPFVTV